MSPLKIDVVTEMPDFSSTGRWRELYEAAEKMEVDQVIRVELENKADVRSAQASLQGSHGVASGGKDRNTLRNRGFRFATRSRSVNGKDDGKWYLFVKRLPNK